MTDDRPIQLRERIVQPGHEFPAYVSQIWDADSNLVMESHFGAVIEVRRGSDGFLRKVEVTT